MDAPTTAAQPTEQLDMGALQGASRHPHPGGPNPTSLSQRTLCRHPSKVGTVCVNRASTGLCGGYRATDIPTATAADPWRNAQARYRSLPGHRGQIHGSSAKTALPNVEDFSEQPREAVGLDGLLRRADRHLSSSLCLRGVGAPEAASPPFQRHLPPQLGMGGTTDRRGASLG